ncbi:MAG TPA: hypothetical protein VHC21_00055 [Candidatus Saccharimonadales bacterium]|nr:hypothetical protein [Candidatus Saccharimonadales bacterium]
MKLTKLIAHARFRLIMLLLMVDTVVFGLTDPQQVPSFMLAGGFVLLAITLYQIILGLLRAANWYGLPGGAHRKRQARTLTGLIGGLIALQSIGELGSRDVLVLLPLAFITYLYISYGKAAQPVRQPAEDSL